MMLIIGIRWKNPRIQYSIGEKCATSKNIQQVKNNKLLPVEHLFFTYCTFSTFLKFFYSSRFSPVFIIIKTNIYIFIYI